MKLYWNSLQFFLFDYQFYNFIFISIRTLLSFFLINLWWSKYFIFPYYYICLIFRIFNVLLYIFQNCIWRFIFHKFFLSLYINHFNLTISHLNTFRCEFMCEVWDFEIVLFGLISKIILHEFFFQFVSKNILCIVKAN